MRVFVDVAAARSFSGAARKLGISQATASKHVRMLEDWLGVRLLHRTTRRVALTDAGEQFFAQSSRILDDIEAARDTARPAATVRGSMRITAPVVFGSTRLAPVVADYIRQHPELSMTVELSDRSVDLIEEGYDLAIRTRPLDGAGLAYYRLMPLNYVICAAPAYLARHGSPESPADLARHQCITGTGDVSANWRFTGADGDAEVQIGGRLQVNNALFRRDAALSGAGVLLCAEYLVENDLISGRLTRLLPDYTPRAETLHAVCAAHRASAPKLRSLINHLTVQLGG
jgi:DNA-binding transcriptional LysR family regulator